MTNSFLSQNFDQTELSSIQNGVRMFIRTLGLIHDPNPLVWNKWFVDEKDAIQAIEMIADRFKRTETFVGKRKYQGADFDAPAEVKKDLKNFLLTGRTPGEEATAQKRNMLMYYAVIEPTIDLFYKFPHEQQIENAKDITRGVVQMILNSADHGTYDDAIVAQAQIKMIIRAKEQAILEEKAKRKRKRKARDPLLELFGLAEEPVDDLTLID